MARRHGTRTAPLILVLILLILVLIFGGLLWFDYLGFLEVREVFYPVLSLVGIGAPKPLPEEEGMYLLEEERIKKLDEALTLREEGMNLREEELNAREAELNQMIEIMTER
ncbi:MAG: flagellar protein FlbB, partial [Spirochaetales bacterium]|nr:flagellar protein FlbB [Spirochaetales bacterium]